MVNSLYVQSFHVKQSGATQLVNNLLLTELGFKDWVAIHWFKLEQVAKNSMLLPLNQLPNNSPSLKIM